MARLGRSYPATRIVVPSTIYTAPTPAFDAEAVSTKQTSVASGTPFTWTHTAAAGAYGIVVLEASSSSSNVGPAAGSATVTFGGSSTTSPGYVYFNNTTTLGYLWVFVIPSVSGGSQTISATLTQSGKTFTGWGSSYTYKNISGTGSLVTAYGTSATSPSASVTAANSTDIVWGIIGTGSTTLSSFSLTQRAIEASQNPSFVAGDTTGSATVSATLGTGMTWAVAGLDLQ